MVALGSQEMKKRGLKCKCIRCREVGSDIKAIAAAELVTRQ